MSELSHRLAELSPERRQLLERLWKERQAAKAPAGEGAKERVGTPGLPFGLLEPEVREKLPDGLEDAYPLTMTQLGMVVQMMRDTDDSNEAGGTPPVYHNVNSFRLQAPFDTEILQTVLDRIVERHAILRTSFDLDHFGGPLQLVHKTAKLKIEVMDLRPLPAAEQQALVDRFIDLENRRLMDLSQPPLMRLHVHRFSDEVFQFTLTEPHAIADGWSTTSTMAEIFDSYAALRRGEELPEPSPGRLAFRDFVALEREAQESPEQRDFWRRQLKGSTISRLPPWRSCSEGAPKHDHKPVFAIEPRVLAGLSQLADSMAVPLKSVLLTAHMKVMALLAGEQDALTGLTSHGRPEEAGGDQLRGLFLNVLPFRQRMVPGTWRQLVRATFESEVELMPYRRYPLGAIQREHGGQTLFETSFVYLRFHSIEQTLRSGNVKILDQGHSDRSLAEFPLSAVFFHNPLISTLLELILENDPQRVPAQQVKWINGYYQRVLEAIATDSEAQHLALCLLSEEEQAQLLTAWNDTAAPYSEERSFSQLFEQRAQEAPDRVALCFEDRRVTYGELDRRTNQLARYLGSLGVGPEVRVALCVERSPEMVLAILGVFKAGGAYVPLDPSYPTRRLTFMLEDCRASVLLTQRHLLEQHSFGDDGADRGARVILLDGLGETLSALPTTRIRASEWPGQLAYLLYTSGSTGKPKGTLVARRNLSNLVQAQIDSFGVASADRVLQFSSLSFDASLFEIVMTLGGGAGLFLGSRETLLPGEPLFDFLLRHAISVVTLPPSVLATLPERRLPALRLIQVAGEACTPDLVERWAGGRRFFNLYGPTEDTVWSTQAECRAETGTVPIGRPVANTRTYLLDAGLQPVPEGVPGELHLAGVGLARGYHERPALTAQKFIPNPFGDEPGDRLYKTGDLVRYLGWALEFIGRADFQVKIRGFRIEPGEIDAVLSSHPGVVQSCVMAREDKPGHRRLVAYLTPSPGVELKVSDLQLFLRERLPNYMVPAAFVSLDTMPLTPSGKVDRAALPAPGVERPELESTFLLPESATEQAIAGVWKEVLQLEKVGAEDNFFDLGGDSLTLFQVHRKLAAGLDHGISMVDLFSFSTIRSLARHLDHRGADHRGAAVPSGDEEVERLSRGRERLQLQARKVKRAPR